MGRNTRGRLSRVVGVGVACFNGDVEAFIIPCQEVRVAVATDQRTVSVPLVADRAHAIGVVHGGGICGEGCARPGNAVGVIVGDNGRAGPRGVKV